MYLVNKLSIPLLLIIILLNTCLADNFSTVFQGKINTDNINIRSDSTVSSEIICKISQGDYVEVISELYKWYKIKLPKTAPSFIKKNLVGAIDVKTAKVLKDRVNIRLRPSELSPILGKVDKNEIINILLDKGDWYKIEPVNNSFGWVHKRFLDKVPSVIKIEETKSAQKTTEENKPISQLVPTDEVITVEGIIRPKIMKRIATHKLITQDKNMFLLKGNKESLDAFNYQKVKVRGKLVSSYKQKYPVVEIVKIEGLD